MGRDFVLDRDYKNKNLESFCILTNMGDIIQCGLGRLFFFVLDRELSHKFIDKQDEPVGWDDKKKNLESF
jgi:hypothetical protein